MKYIALLLLSLFAGMAFADGISIGVGKLANNVNHSQQGWLAEAQYNRGPFQFAFTEIHDSYLGDELNSTLLYKKKWGNFGFAGGIVLAHTQDASGYFYSTGGWINVKDLGINSQCFLCGEALQVSYSFSPHWELQARYMGNKRFLLPSHNGALVVLRYEF